MNNPAADKPKALIAMSGGVDSSVAALLMARQGYDCLGVTLKLFENEDLGLGWDRSCCSLKDAQDAREAALKLGIEHRILNFNRLFREKVMDNFVEEYAQGRTPNPCIACNRFLKFGALIEWAASQGRDLVVTGHYAQIEKDRASGRFLLKKGQDPAKDQSYVLYAMTQGQLKSVMFPLGGMEKREVRALAESRGLGNAGKQESQDICFVPSGHYGEFIRGYSGRDFPPGNFVDPGGKILGHHRGIIFYTLGQRRGLKIALNKPVYVAAIKPETNEVVLCEDEGLFSKTLFAEDINLIPFDTLPGRLKLKAKIRYRQAEQPATVEQTDSSCLRVEFEEPQRAITPGQALALYDGPWVVGGGTIRG
ncbi:MAG: tRNA 2-thiouridine(34) synthase MnmA [Spirochaetales bacterium]|jgi:tRNA-specific 2-thiouridylase|nr:tRNA 2-thiouridine(34) synthase MnmA [Spirochaetales bacterium]